VVLVKQVILAMDIVDVYQETFVIQVLVIAIATQLARPRDLVAIHVR
jgi:hypothetical protein